MNRAMLRGPLSVAGILLASQVTAATHNAESFPFGYIGLDIGQARYHSDDSDATSRSENNLAGGGHLGYQFNPYFSTELAYQYLGDGYASAPAHQLIGSFSQVALSARLGYPITDKLSHYLKLGGAAWFADLNSMASADSQGFSPVYGTGLAYTFSDNLTVRFEYQITSDIGNDAIGYANHSQASLGLSWQFGRAQKTAPVASPVTVASPVAVPIAPKPVAQEENKTVVIPEHFSTLFAHNSSTLLNSAALIPVVELMKQQPHATITLIGHTDSSGSEKYNLRKSKRRASAVANYLISQGIDQDRITTIGKGEAEPIADNHSAEGRGMNRRVEITIQSSR
ncbi:OmpA family protein [Vibrio alfacsensis]|uniref:OmpA family protein n=1 Tax=Vibrio alfacsensis TaxID=1074311 RepID=UPI004068E164